MNKSIEELYPYPTEEEVKWLYENEHLQLQRVIYRNTVQLIRLNKNIEKLLLKGEDE